MKVAGRIKVKWNWVPGETITVDEMNRTSLFANNESVDLYDVFPHMEVGDVVKIDIPSGLLVIKTDSVSLERGPLGHLTYRTGGEFSWSGRFNGLVGGMSGVAVWNIHVDDQAEVTTSAWDVPIPWRTYLDARRSVNQAEWELQYWLGPRDYQTALRHQISKRMSLPPLEDVEEEIDLDLELPEEV